MNNKNKSILRAIIALMLVISSVFVMSSCMFFDVEAFFEDYLNDNNREPEEGYRPPFLPDNKDPNPDDSTEIPNEDVTYYPSDGSVSSEQASPLNKTLLSTVIVISEFDENPSAGAGVFYKLDKENGDAYIITNYHVIYDADEGICDKISIYLFGMELQQYVVSATCVGGSVTYDIAVLKVENSEILKNSAAVEVKVGNSDEISVFDTVYTIGNPKAEGIAANKGIISVVSEYLTLTGADNTDVELRVIRIDAAVNSGNSGGGLYNEDGELIGIVCAKRIGSDVDDMGYALPSNLVKALVENILDNCDGVTNLQIMRPLLGIEITAKTMGVIVDPETGDIKRVAIVEISNVFDTCPLKGQLQIGDVITEISVNGVSITPTQIYHVTDHMMNGRVGDTVITTILRGEETLSFETVITVSNISLVK